MQRQLEEGDLIPLFNQNEFNISDRQETPSFNTLRPKRRPRVNPLLIVLVLGILLFIIIVSALNSTSQPKVIETKPDPVKVEPPPSKNAKNHISFNNLGSLYSTSPNDLEWTTTGVDGSYIKHNGIYILIAHVETNVETILADVNDFVDVCIFNLESRKTNLCSRICCFSFT